LPNDRGLSGDDVSPATGEKPAGPMSQLTIDLNADLGESAERLARGSDAELMRYITSASIACGGHAGDAHTMEQTLELACQNYVAVGAHPSYPDRAGFGRTPLRIPIAELQSSIADQISQLLSIARRLKVPVVHVKPHGALYHSCNHDAEIARALCRAVLAVDSRIILIGQAGSPCLDIYREMAMRTAAEAFADRAYEPDGTLRNRSLPGALLESPERASAQAVSLVTRGRVATTSGSELAISADTLCIHSDTPGSPSIARAIKEGLAASSVSLRRLQV
jgi:5-oxoprolinase (ATP-hydrolysing) subunit A